MLAFEMEIVSFYVLYNDTQYLIILSSYCSYILYRERKRERERQTDRKTERKDVSHHGTTCGISPIGEPFATTIRAAGYACLQMLARQDKETQWQQTAESEN